MRILIVGKNGYLAKKLKDFLIKFSYDVDSISLRSNFNEIEILTKEFDVLIHLSALVHQNEKKYKYEDYKNANVFLPFKIAKLCEEKKIKHFIFMSSMAVFGKLRRIDVNKEPFPVSFYGQSKREAEKMLIDFFKDKPTKISIIRSPVIIGNNAPGNPRLLKKVSEFFFFFPKITNKRSIIFIRSLLEHIQKVINLEMSTISHPQMNKLFSTGEIISIFRKLNKQKSINLFILNIFVYLFWFIPIIRKTFNNQYYDLNTYSNKNELYTFSDANLLSLYE